MDCREHDQEICEKYSCQEGSFFNETTKICVEHTCTCNNGVHAIGSNCSEHGNEQCLGCFDGFSFAYKFNGNFIDKEHVKMFINGNYPTLQKTCTKNLHAYRSQGPCESKPCKNSAICYDSFDDFMCACKPGFTGKDCGTVQPVCSDIQPDWCKSVLTMNMNNPISRVIQTCENTDSLVSKYCCKTCSEIKRIQ